MSGIRIVSLYSGSAGNAYLIAAPGGSVLVDAGKSAHRLTTALRAVGSDAGEIKAIFLTHEHTDHVGALGIFLKKNPVPVHLPEACAARLAAEPAVAACLCPHPPIHTVSVPGMRVTSFPTPHDSLGSVGYRFEIPLADGRVFRYGHATDMGYVAPAVEKALTGCDAVTIESNHDVEMVHTGPYPEHLKQRVLSRRGHLSNEESACFAARLCASGTRSVMLAHVSPVNNTPELAFETSLCAIGSGDVHLCVALAEESVELPLDFSGR